MIRYSDTAVGSDSDDPLAGDPELRKELAQMFLEDYPKLQSAIRESMTRRDGPSLKHAAHTLKGSVGVFKVEPAFDAVVRIEHIGEKCDWEHAEEAWVGFVGEMAGLSAMLSILLNPTSRTDAY